MNLKCTVVFLHLPPQYTFEITRIEVVGSCANQAEILQSAFKAIVAASEGIPIHNTSVSMPYCIEEFPIGSGIWEPCPSYYCCEVRYFAGWDSINGDYFLHSKNIVKHGAGITCPCDEVCSYDNLPEIGTLNIGSKLPEACLSTCNPDYKNPYSWAEISGPEILSGLYTLGKENDDTPCFSFHYFWQHYGFNTPEILVEKLVKRALKDIWQNGNPQYISVNLPKCIEQPYPGRTMYVKCYNEIECCKVKFEIIAGGNLAKVVEITPAQGSCGYSCIEICNLFTLDTEYGIPKLAVQGELDGTNQSLKVIPNPTTGVFNIEFGAKTAGTHLIKVVDIRGIEVFNQEINTIIGLNTFNLDLTNIPHGVYYLQLLSEGMMISNVKFIKN